jgi:hypothetical protein
MKIFRFNKRFINTNRIPKIDTVIFNLYDTIVVPKTKYLSAPIQSFVSTFEQLDYDTYNNEFIRILNKYRNFSNYEILVYLLNDSDMNILYKKKNPYIYYDYYNMYQLYLRNYSVILQNRNYTMLEPSLLQTIKTLQNQGIQNFTGVSDLNFEMTSIILTQMKQQGLELKYVMSNYNTNISKQINNIIKKTKTKPENCIIVSNKLNDIIEAKKELVYSVGLVKNVKPLEFIVCETDYLIDNIGQLPYIVSKIKLEL